jgi:hypothetical protein
LPQLSLRDRFWRTLLSERTLQAMLFLGIFLLFAAALSFVLWGWQDFCAPLRVAIPTLFTLIFPRARLVRPHANANVSLRHCTHGSRHALDACSNFGGRYLDRKTYDALRCGWVAPSFNARSSRLKLLSNPKRNLFYRIARLRFGRWRVWSPSCQLA